MFECFVWKRAWCGLMVKTPGWKAWKKTGKIGGKTVSPPVFFLNDFGKKQKTVFSPIFPFFSPGVPIRHESKLSDFEPINLSTHKIKLWHQTNLIVPCTLSLVIYVPQQILSLFLDLWNLKRIRMFFFSIRRVILGWNTAYWKNSNTNWLKTGKQKVKCYFIYLYLFINYFEIYWNLLDSLCYVKTDQFWGFHSELLCNWYDV